MDPLTAFALASGVSAVGNIFGAKLSGDAAERANNKNADLQREFAQNGLQWKVADAVKAGIHPTAALGAAGYQAAPSYIGDNSMANAVSGIGQDVSRAVMASANAQEREIHALTVQRMKLENAKLGQELGAIAASQVGPPMPGSNDLVRPQPATPVVQRPDAPGQEPGSIADYGYARRGDEFFIVPSKDVKERTEDNMVQELGWLLRNQVAPTLFRQGDPRKLPVPPDVPLKKGHHWEFNGIRYKMVPGSPSGIDG